jgi:hypothetical protein
MVLNYKCNDVQKLFGLLALLILYENKYNISNSISCYYVTNVNSHVTKMFFFSFLG